MSNVYSILGGPADAVLLLNPAFEAVRFAALNDLMRNEERFSPEQAPLLITISTDNDFATRHLFPLGQIFGLNFHAALRTTLGNFDPYYTHSLLKVPASNCETTRPFDITEVFYASGLCLRRETNWHERNLSPTIDHFGWSSVRPENQKYNPFMVVHTTKEVINNHGGIWEGPVFPDWIFAIVKSLDSRRDQFQSAKQISPFP
jgi:hypothetical protein